jgi:hypothetical protein
MVYLKLLRVLKPAGLTVFFFLSFCSFCAHLEFPCKLCTHGGILPYRRLAQMSCRPMDFNKRREASSIAYWRISRSWIALPLISFNNRTSPEKPVWATSAYNPGKYGNSPVGCRPKEGKAVQKTQAIVFFCCQLGPLCIFSTCLAFGVEYLDLDQDP